jgi:hypothetical protein
VRLLAVLRVSVLVVSLALAGSARAEEAPASGPVLTFGSKPDETAEGGAIIFAAGLKARSHFGFGEHGSRAGELGFGRDLGVSSTLPAPGLRLVVNAGDFGWVGGELLGFAERGDVAQVDRLRVLDGVTIAPGDVLESSTRTLWGGLHYGFEGRLRLSKIVDVSVSPTFGFGFFDLDARVKQIFPRTSPGLGGHATSFVLAPGARFEVELLDTVRAGLEGEIGLTGLHFAVSTPHVNLWERVRVYFGVTISYVDLTVGWRLAATHLEGDGAAMDMRLTGVDATLGFRF